MLPPATRSNPSSPRSQPSPLAPTPSDVRISGGSGRPAQTEPGLAPRGTGNPTHVRGNAAAPVGGSVRPLGGSVRGNGAKPAATAPELYSRGNPRASTGTGIREKPIDLRYMPTKPVAGNATPKPFEPQPTARPKGPSASPRYSTGTTPTPSLTPGSPKLGPRNTAVPRLQPRSLVSGSAGRTLVSGSIGTVGSFTKPCSSTWNSWWDPCHSSWHSGCWSFHGGHGCWDFGVSWWYPWYHHCHWGYSSCWWNSWCDPWYPSWNHWWYPSSTYCPTYLYVPSSVVVVDQDYASGGEEVIVAGAAERGLSPHELARKYVELGDFYFKAGRFAEAEDAYARARTYAPDDPSIHFVLADAAFATGDYHFAAFLIAEALRLDPAMASAKTDKRLFYGDPKAFDEQMAQLDKYLTDKPYDGSAHLVRGYNLRFSEQPVKAISAFRRVLEISPEQPAARTFLAALESAKGEEPAKKDEKVEKKDEPPAKVEEPKKG